MTKEESLEKALKAYEMNKQISQRNRRKRLLKEALLENGVGKTSISKASLDWLENKADEMGLVVAE